MNYYKGKTVELGDLVAAVIQLEPNKYIPVTAEITHLDKLKQFVGIKVIHTPYTGNFKLERDMYPHILNDGVEHLKNGLEIVFISRKKKVDDE